MTKFAFVELWHLDLSFLFCVVALICLLKPVVEVKFAKDKIAMYEEQNSRIEEQIDVAVKQYMEYESDTYAITAPESSITSVSYTHLTLPTKA